MPPQTIESKHYYYRFEEIDGDTNLEAEPPPYVEPPAIEPIIHRNFFSRLASRVFDTENDKFNIIFAVIMPMICFALDPIVFREGGMLSDYRGFAWSLAAVTIVASAVTLAVGPRFGAMNAVLAGLFLASGIVSLLVGLALLPLSIFASLMLIGLLGFTPLFSSVSMIRLARRLIKESSPHLETGAAINVMMFTAFVSIVLPYIFNLEFGKLIDKIF